MNVRLRESENKAKFVELLFDTEESKVVDIGGRGLFGGVLQRKGKQRDFGAPDILGKIGIGTFHLHLRLFFRNYPGRILNPVKNTVMDFLHDIIDGNRSTGILETGAAMIASRGGEQRAVGGEEVEANETEFFDERNQSVKNLLIEGFADTTAEVGEGGLTGDAIAANANEAAVLIAAQRIAQDKTEILDGSNSIEITEQIEKEERNGIIAGSAKNGISISGNGTDKREVNGGGDQLRGATLGGSIVVDMDEFLSELVMGKPAGLFLGKWFTVPVVDKRIDFPELSDNIGNCEANEFAHVKSSGASRENLPPSKTLPGSPFLLINANHPTSTNPIQTNASDSSISTNTGGVALRSFSWA